MRRLSNVASLRSRVALGVIAVAVLMQAYRPARTNPPIDPQQELSAVMHVDPAVQPVLDRSCNDCHSNRTVWPWYSQVAPISWGVVSDVSDGRRHMNFSEWGAYPGFKQKDMLNEACKLVTRRDMPPFVYSLVHRDTVLSQAEREALCGWTKTVTQ
jgi:hypothetical protein